MIRLFHLVSVLLIWHAVPGMLLAQTNRTEVPAPVGRAPNLGTPAPKPFTIKLDSAESIVEFDQIYGYLQTADFGSGGGSEPVRRVMEFGKKYPATAAAYALLGELKYVQAQLAGDCGATDEVTMLARQAISINPQSAEGYTLGAKVALCDGNAQQYLYADRAIALAPDKPEANFVKARVLAEQEKYKEAEQFYLKTISLLKDPARKANVYTWMARMLTGDERPRQDVLADIGKAEDAYRKIVQFNPKTVASKCELARFLVQYKTDVTEAAGLAQQVRRESGNCYVHQTALIGYAIWAKSVVAGKSSAGSLNAVIQSAGLQPDDAFILASRYPARNDVVHALLKEKAITNIDTLGRGRDRGLQGCCPAIVNAAYQGDVELVSLLLKNGANANAQGDNGRTPLTYAIFGADVKLTKLLLENGARPNVAAADGAVPIYTALYNKRNAAKLIELLLENRANPNATVSGKALLAWAVQFRNVEVLKLLIVHGADPNPPTPNRGGIVFTPFRMAVTWGDPDMVAVLLAAGAKIDVNEKDAEEFTRTSISPQPGPEQLKQYQAVFSLINAARSRLQASGAPR